MLPKRACVAVRSARAAEGGLAEAADASESSESEDEDEEEDEDEDKREEGETT